MNTNNSFTSASLPGPLQLRAVEAVCVCHHPQHGAEHSHKIVRAPTSHQSNAAVVHSMTPANCCRYFATVGFAMGRGGGGDGGVVSLMQEVDANDVSFCVAQLGYV